MPSTVIKAGQAGPILQRLSTVDLADHLSQAKAVIDDAKRRGFQITRQADEDARRLREEARKLGHKEGYEAGYAEGTVSGRQAGFDEALDRFDKAHANIVASMEQAIVEMDRIKADLAIAAERNLLDFAVRIAARLTFAVGRMHRESARANLQRAIRLVGTKTDMTIRAHPDDVVSLKIFAPSVLERALALPSVSVQPDDQQSPGGCKVTCGPADVDASLDTQVDEMVSLLLGDGAGDG